MILTREQIAAPWEEWPPGVDEMNDLIDTARAYHDLRDAVRALCDEAERWALSSPSVSTSRIRAALDGEA